MDADDNLAAIAAEIAAVDAQINAELDQVAEHRGAARMLQAKRDALLNREAVARKLAAMSPQERSELNRQLGALSAS